MREIRIEISSDFPGPNASLLARVAKCPLARLVGNRNNIQISMSHADLIRLRSNPAQYDLQFLRNVGEQIQKYLGPTIWAAIQASLAFTQGEKLRIAIYVHPSAIGQLGQGQVRSDEVPVELIWDSNDDFYGLNFRTPIIRGLSVEADRDTQNIIVPLKVLVIISTPSDKPRSSMDTEKLVIEQALQNLLPNVNAGTAGIILPRWCMPGTKRAFEEMLNNFNPHVIHFVGHGGFDIIQEGQVAQGYLCFQEETPPYNSDPMTAEDLAVLLRNTSTPVGLVVMTSCSSAQPAPLNHAHTTPYYTLAFEGVAQKLVAGNSGITAAVAMQFDIEENAAVEFTHTFYNELIKPDVTIEEVVTRARISISRRMGIAHPAWVSPVLFSRSIDGVLFHLQHAVGNLSPDEESKLAKLDQEIRIYRQGADKAREVINKIPSDETQEMVTRDLLGFWVKKVEQADLERSTMLGDSIRIHGKRIQKNVDIELSVSLHVRIPMNIDRIEFDIQYSTNVLLNGVIRAGQHTQTIAPRVSPGQGINNNNVVLLWPPGGSQQFVTGEYEIAKLAAHVSTNAPLGFTDVYISNIGIYGNNRMLGNRGMSGLLFVED